MGNIRFYKGNKANLPSTGVDNFSIYFVEDTQEVFKSTGNGLPLSKYTDVIVVSALPNSNQMQGKIYANITDNLLYRWTGTEWKQMGGQPITFTPTSTDEFQNKTIDATKNTITKISTTNFATGVIDADTTLASASDTKIPTQKAIKSFVETKVAEINSAMIGDLIYKGVINASSLGSQLDNAKKGWYFKVSVAGTLLGLELSVGDVVIVNTDITGTPTDSTKLDKIDNTESSDLLRTSNISTNIDLTQDTSKIADRATLKTVMDNYLAWGSF